MNNRPGPKGNWLIGSAADFARNPIRFFSGLRDNFGAIAYFRWGFSMQVAFISKPEWLQQVLQKNAKNYEKGDNGLKMLVGNGLLTSDGDFWLRQRRLTSPVFHKKKIAEFGDTMVAYTDHMLTKEWKAFELSGEKFDLTQQMMALTLAITGDTLMSWKVKEENKTGEIYKSVAWLIDDTMRRTMDVVTLPFWVPTLRNKKFKREHKVLMGLTDGVIADHMQKPGEYQDLLAMLIAAEDADTGEKMSPQQLKDEALTLILAGHETTALASTWSFYLLDQNPAQQALLLEELKTVLGDRLPCLTDLPNLPYLSRVIDEVLRMYPPAWFIPRKAINEDQLGEFKIDKGMEVIMSPYTMHHNPEYWPDPAKFDPDRFLPEKVSERLKFTYLPFGGGPRICIGNNFALMEIQLLLATVLCRYKVTLHPGTNVKKKATITLKPKGPVFVTLQKR